MKQFDPASISLRFLTYLSNTNVWSQLIGDSATVSLANAIGEVNGEIARYSENLLAEAKWENAQNISSYITEASYLGYVPQKKVSALGNIYISHDPTLLNSGLTIFSASNLQSTLSYYTGADIPIPAGTVFSTTVSPTIKYILTESVVYSGGRGSAPSLQYLEVPVMQGISQVQTITVLGTAFEEIVITDSTLEDASNNVSSKFFNLSFVPLGGSNSINLQRLESIFLADNMTYAFDTRVSTDLTSTIIRFGDGTTGMVLPGGSTVTISYISSLGASGNLNKNFVVNNNNTLATTGVFLYSTNFDSILGGADSDTIHTIRAKAPNASISSSNGGSIITLPQYKNLIESLPYIQTSIVYSGNYYNPVTQLTTKTILYSAINTSGKDILTQYPNFGTTVGTSQGIIPTLLINKNSPLDNPIYVSPTFLHIRYNYQGKVSSTNVATIQNTIKNDIYSKYGTLTQKFNTVFDTSNITTYASSTYSVTQTSVQLEAIQSLQPSSFTSDILIPNNYKQNFYFDPSFKSFWGLDSNHLYCLKINIIFTCAQCPQNSRTIFLIKDYTQSKIDYVCTFTGAVAAGTYNILFNNSIVPITIPTSSTPISVMYAIYQALSVATLPNYTFTWNQSGTITVRLTTGAYIGNPLSNSTIPNTLFTGSNVGLYTAIQCTYIPSITDFNFLQNNVFATNGIYQPLTATTSATISNFLVPIVVTLDYNSLNPTSNENILLGSGSISIPSYVYLNPGVSNIPTKYMDFSTGGLLDENVIIEVIAQPISPIITPYQENNIVQLEQNLQNSTIVDDVVIQLASS